MGKTRYKQSNDGELKIYKKEKFTLIKGEDNRKKNINGYHMKICCCDCSLVHDIYLWVEKDKLYKVPLRDNRATGQRRRRNKYEKTQF